ncbi:MAG: HlyD family secretion protein [Coxiellaceae bacterium]|nr:HlyD family secretion protein [Coxiellaceae bacterium]
MKKTIKFSVSILVVIMLVLVGYVYWHHGKLYPSTSDAYVQANLVNIAPRVSGRVSQTLAENNKFVAKGQLLFSIDPQPYQIAVNKAQATLDQTIQEVKALEKAVNTAKAILAERKAELIIAQQNYKRIIILVKKRSASLQDGDTYTSRLSVAKAAYNAAEAEYQQAKEKLGKNGIDNPQVQQARAALDQAKLNLSYTQIKAPASGTISNFRLRVGDQVNANQSDFALIENQDWWAQANFKETDMSRIKPGQTATIKVDMYPNTVFKGTVVSLSRGSGTTFSLLPPENASGNWVKVTQRFPIRIHINDPNSIFRLRMGASCTVKINTTTHKS